MQRAHLLLEDPSGEGASYDPFLNCVRAQYGMHSIGSLLSPNGLFARSAVELLHEYCHFYQLTTTTFGLYYRLIQFAEYQKFCKLMRLSSDSRKPLSFPVVPSPSYLRMNRSLPSEKAYEQAMSRHQEESDSRSEALKAAANDPIERTRLELADLEAFRIAICSYGELRTTWGSELAPLIMHEVFSELPCIIATWPPSRYEWARDLGLGDLLESHALLMSGLWMRSSCRVLHAEETVVRWVDQIVKQVLDESLSVYRRIFGIMLPESASGKMLAALASCMDLALNPSLVYQPGDHGVAVRINSSGVMHYRTDVDFEPLTRFLLLGTGLHHHDAARRFTSLDGDRVSWASAINELAESQIRSLGLVDSCPKIPPFKQNHALFSLVAARQVMSSAMNAEIPLSVGFLFGEMFGCLIRALTARQDAPLLLSSGTHAEISWLISRLGGVNTIASREERVYVRKMMGLELVLDDGERRLLADIAANDPGRARFGVSNNKSGEYADSVSDWVARTGLPHLEAFRILLTKDADHIRKVMDQPLFGFAGSSLRDILGWHKIRSYQLGF